MRKGTYLGVGICLVLVSAVAFLGCPNQWMGGYDGSQEVSLQWEDNTPDNGESSSPPSDGAEDSLQIPIYLGGNTNASSSVIGGQTNPSADFSCVDNRDGTVTCTASVTGATAYNYSWNTNDEIGVAGETAKLKLLGGKQTITLYVDIDGKWQNPLIVTKTVNVGVAPTDRVFLFTKDKSEPQYMYFAVKVKGSSPTGLFRQKVGNEYAYARDLHAEVSTPVATIGGVPTKYSNFNGKDVMTLCTNYNICVVGYNAKTGFATEDGKSFEFPFYYGDDNFRVAKNGSNTLQFAFESFVVRDTTKDGLLSGLGHPSFAAIHGAKKLTLSIPMQNFVESKHRNIALFTINFENYNGTGLPKVTFDGFVEK